MAAGGQRSRWRQRRRGIPKPIEADVGLEDQDVETVDAENERILSIKEEMDTLDQVIAMIKGKGNAMATQLRTGVEEQLKVLRIERTKRKPLHMQVRTL